MQITRKQVLMAVRYEPLFAGSWVRSTVATDKPCEVCAVGATLRRCGLTDDEIDNIGYNLYDLVDGKVNDARHIRKHLRNKNFLAALSCYWEGVVARKFGVDADDLATAKNITPEAREMLATWVEKHIPVKFAAKGLK